MVDRLVRLTHVDQNAEDPCVGRMLEILLADLLLDTLVEHTPRRQQHGAKKPLFRINALREGPVNIR